MSNLKQGLSTLPRTHTTTVLTAASRRGVEAVRLSTALISNIDSHLGGMTVCFQLQVQLKSPINECRIDNESIFRCPFASFIYRSESGHLLLRRKERGIGRMGSRDMQK
ncbi:hypothetical protein CDAR_437561 [Caerostris darwini]|uniref:Uncharacterized protein n=1 Tax=Caerostris darwini TaxID=1538125 RepID=A0AAV4NXZ1_9ARAC|nr:hypothetical protein CDAR_437561 [Caerostris darwini]